MDVHFNLVLEAYTSKKKHHIIYNCESVINSSGGWITDFNTLSDKMIHFVFECDFINLLIIYKNLEKRNINFYDFSKEQLKLLKPGKKTAELIVSLSIHFVGGEKGDLGTKSN